MSNLSLTQLQESVEDKFGDFTVELPAPTKDNPDATEEVAFRYYLRVSKAAREKLAEAYSAMANTRREGGEGGSLLDVFRVAMEGLAVKPADFKKLDKALGEDLVLWAAVVNAYAERYEPQTGGSLALAEILDEYAEEVYVSLKQDWGFDLLDWLAARDNRGPAVILAMLRHLPEGSLYRATMEARYELELKELKARKEAGEDVELPEEHEPSDFERLVAEKRSWTLLPSLMAEGLNRDRALIWAQFDKEHRPDLPAMGPEAWWPESQKKTPEKSADGERRKPSRLERHFGKLAASG